MLARNDRTALFDQRSEVADSVIQDRFAAYAGEEVGAAGLHLRKIQQVMDEGFHAFRAFDDEVDELIRVALKLTSVTLGQELGVDRDGAQRLLQIVAGDVRKLLQLLVGT